MLKYHFSFIRLAKIQKFDCNVLAYYIGKAVGKHTLIHFKWVYTYITLMEDTYHIIYPLDS